MQMLSLREQIRQTECAFSVIIADEPELVEAACRLRYQVYCLEREFEPGSNGIETDEFDGDARHVLLVHRDSGETIGTARVIPSSATYGVGGLPIIRVCAPDLLRHLPSRTTGEISRFAVSKQRRMSVGTSALARFSLMQGVLRISLDMGLTHWCAIMEPTLLRLLHASSVCFRSLGAPVEHHGLRQPAWLEISDVLDHARYEEPEAWNYVTRGGMYGTARRQHLARPEPRTSRFPSRPAVDTGRPYSPATVRAVAELEDALTN